MYSGPLVVLDDILENKETRVGRQREWIEAHSLPLISFTINMIGGVKLNQISRIAFEQGCIALVNQCQRYGVSIFRLNKYITSCGPELLAAVDGIDPQLLKHRLVAIEEEHTLGRLFDIDVLDAKGRSISRDELGLPRRQCLICNEEAKVCARSRAHPLSNLIDKMSEMINDCNQLN